MLEGFVFGDGGKKEETKGRGGLQNLLAVMRHASWPWEVFCIKDVSEKARQAFRL